MSNQNYIETLLSAVTSVSKVAGTGAVLATAAIKVGDKSRNRRIDTPINR